MTADSGGDEPAGVLTKVREVLRVVLLNTADSWPSVDRWRDVLPSWFVARCAPEQSQAEAAEWLKWWRSLPAHERAAAELARPWTLSNWIYWLEPVRREWFWWDGFVDEAGIVHVSVQVMGWPAPLGALDWLLRAGGAQNVAHN